MAIEQLYHSIFNQSEDIMIITDAKSKIIDANIHACNFLEKELDELKRTKLSDFLSDSSSIIYDEALHLTEQGENAEIDVRLKGFDNTLDAFLRLVKANNDFFWILSAQRLEQESMYSKESSTIDHVTQLYNHLKLEQVLEVELSKSMRYHSNVSLSLILLCIDDYDEIINVYGQKVSHLILFELAKLLEMTIRTSDLIVRWKNSEFMILVPSNDIFEITTFASKLREIVENHTYAKDKKITCSFGITKYNNEDYKKEQLINRATAALNKAIERGKNRVEVS